MKECHFSGGRYLLNRVCFSPLLCCFLSSFIQFFLKCLFPSFLQFRFFYDANEICFTHMPHAAWFTGALLCIFVLLCIMVIAAFLAMNQTIPGLGESQVQSVERKKTFLYSRTFKMEPAILNVLEWSVV